MSTPKATEDWASMFLSELAALKSIDLGYPQGSNEVRPPLKRLPSEIPDALKALYSEFDGLSMPDVHVGYFIDPASRVVSASERGEPEHMANSNNCRFRVFGSDGGGGRFVVEILNGAVLYLPSSGLVRDKGFYPVPESPVRHLSASVNGFLRLLFNDVHAFVCDDRDHRYMIS